MKLKDMRIKVDTLESEIFEYFETKDIDTTEMDFTDIVGSHINYGEYDSIEEIEGFVDNYLEYKERQQED